MAFLPNFRSALSNSSTRKTLLAIFGLAFLIAVIPLLVTAVRYRQELRKAAVGEFDDTAVLSLQPEETSIAKDESVTVEVKLDTGGQDAHAVDVIVGFVPDVLELTGIDPNTATNFRSFAPVVDDQGGFDVDRVRDCANLGSHDGEPCERGKIEFGATTFDFSNPDQDPYDYPVNGANILIANLHFKGKSEGTSALNFDFDPSNKSKTTDCNVVKVDRTQDVVDDILNGVTNTEIAVGQCQWNYCGDVDCDGDVDTMDATYFIFEYNGNHQEGRDADLDNDGDVDGSDATRFIFGFNNTPGSGCEDAP